MNLFSGILFFALVSIVSTNKYTKETNQNVNDLKNPFRMGKLNTLWEKARKFLSEPKLKKFLSELKIQDQEELTFKKLKAAGGDKDGLKEAELRKKLLSITKKYGITDPYEPLDAAAESKAEKAIFKDKKLHKLWLKAEQSGLTQEELKALKEEFQHHQDKIDEYHTLISQMTTSNDVAASEVMNDIHQMESMEGSVKDYNDNINSLRKQHKDLKKGYHELHRKAVSGPDSKEFLEPKVAGLWKMALRADFDDAELESLHTELKHYESRLFKLRHLEGEFNRISIDKLDEFDVDDQEKILRDKSTEGQRILEERVEKQRRKVDKLHDHLETRIVSRHTEF